jgi:hypothetical protein
MVTILLKYQTAIHMHKTLAFCCLLTFNIYAQELKKPPELMEAYNNCKLYHKQIYFCESEKKDKIFIKEVLPLINSYLQSIIKKDYKKFFSFFSDKYFYEPLIKEKLPTNKKYKRKEFKKLKLYYQRKWVDFIEGKREDEGGRFCRVCLHDSLFEKASSLYINTTKILVFPSETCADFPNTICYDLVIGFECKENGFCKDLHDSRQEQEYINWDEIPPLVDEYITFHYAVFAKVGKKYKIVYLD